MINLKIGGIFNYSTYKQLIDHNATYKLSLIENRQKTECKDFKL